MIYSMLSVSDDSASSGDSSYGMVVSDSTVSVAALLLSVVQLPTCLVMVWWSFVAVTWPPLTSVTVYGRSAYCDILLVVFF